jgi:hypothetical protein
VASLPLPPPSRSRSHGLGQEPHCSLGPLAALPCSRHEQQHLVALGAAVQLGAGAASASSAITAHKSSVWLLCKRQ